MPIYSQIVYGHLADVLILINAFTIISPQSTMSGKYNVRTNKVVYIDSLDSDPISVSSLESPSHKYIQRV